jgi:predicted ATPase
MKAIALAEKLGENEYRLHAMWSLFIYRMYVGDFRGALAVAETCCRLEYTRSDATAQLIGDRLKGIALHYLGDHASARHHLNNVLSECGATVHRPHIFGFLVEHRVTARAMLSRVLWMQGFPDQAVGNARDAVDEAKESDQALSVCTALAHAACPIALYVGDLAEAERLISMLMEYSAKHPLSLWDPLGRCLKGALLLARGEVAGLGLLRAALDWLRGAGFGYYDAIFLGTLAEGMAVAGQLPAARVVIDEALDRCERSEGRWCLPELLRIKGELLRLAGPSSIVKEAEDYFRQAIDCARRQGALSWEMRAVTSLAEVWHAGGKTAEAKQLLSSAYNRFTEGFETHDLRTARTLIDEFCRPLADG